MSLLMKRNFPMMNNSLFEDFFDDFFGTSNPELWVGKEKSSYPMNVYKIKKDGKVTGCRIEYALAGFAKDEIKISVSDGILTIKAEHNTPENESDEETIYNGISYRKMSMSYRLMDDADKSKITSKFNNGLLSITIPVKEIVDESTSIDIE